MKYPKMLRLPLENMQKETKHYANKKDIELLLSDEVVIEEKLDGSIVSFTRDGSDIITYGRRNEIMRNGILKNKSKAYVNLDEWYWNNYELIQKIPDGWTIFGEWLYAKHTIFYDRLFDYWLCFDIFNGKEFVFLNDRESNFLDDLDLCLIRVIDFGNFSISDLKKYVNTKKSAYGDTTEGFVIKNFKRQLFMKFVKYEFDIDLEESEHWLNQPLEINRLIK